MGFDGGGRGHRLCCSVGLGHRQGLWVDSGWDLSLPALNHKGLFSDSTGRSTFQTRFNTIGIYT